MSLLRPVSPSPEVGTVGRVRLVVEHPRRSVAELVEQGLGSGWQEVEVGGEGWWVGAFVQ